MIKLRKNIQKSQNEEEKEDEEKYKNIRTTNQLSKEKKLRRRKIG